MVRRSKRRRGFGGATLAFAVALLLALAPPSTDPAVEDPADVEGVKEAVESIQATLEDLDEGKLEAEAREVAQDRGLIPAATTCGMRRPGVLPHADRDTRTVFAAAAFATDPAVKVALLDSLAASGSAEFRARAQLDLAHLALRQRRPDTARGHALAVLQAETLPPSCQSDAWMVLALVAERSDEREDALMQAVQLDPGSWLAQQALTVTLARALDTPSAPTVCARRANALIRSIVALDMLAQSDDQLARLERVFATPAEGASSVTPGRALVLGMVRERSARPEAARAIYADGLAGTGAQGGCGSILKSALAQRLQKLETASTEKG
jgi:hypothetical protein